MANTAMVSTVMASTAAVSIDALIHAIELIQPVMNKESLLGLDKSVSRAASLVDADNKSIAFLADGKYLSELDKTNAGVLLISQKFADKVGGRFNDGNTDTTVIWVKDAYLAHASISTLFAYQAKKIGIHHTAIIDDTAKIGEGVEIGAYAVIGRGVVIGAGTIVGSHVTIEDFAKIGNDCHLYNHVNIAHHCVLGDNVRIHAFAAIGSEGFGFAPKIQETGVAWQRIAQLGRVIIGNNVRIGSQTCVDRGAVDDTIIGNDVIIDNLVQIAHNVKIGQGTAIAANTGIAGSTTIGKHCIIAGAVGISGHLTIADGVTFTGMSMVIKSIDTAGVYSSGTPAMPSADWRRAAVKFRQMGEK